MPKVRKNFRLTPEAEKLLEKLVAKLGLTETAVVELAIRRLAELEKIKGD
jgi:hypothetical protein